MLALLALSPLLGHPSSVGCAKDGNGVVGVACKDFCECGHQACSAGKKNGKIHEDASDRCYVHDPVSEAKGDCTTDVRCCIPAEQCDPTCTLDQQSSITWLLKEIANVTSENCAVHFLAQVRGMTQNDDALCQCIHSSLDAIEANGRPKDYVAAVDAINDARCRMTVGDDNTFHDVTTRCMRTSVVGQPKLFSDNEGIKFFLPPGEMVDLVTWESPSGKPVALRGSVFQQEGSLTGSRFGNVQWFRRFELTVANETAMSVTSSHRPPPERPEDERKDGARHTKPSPLASASPPPLETKTKTKTKTKTQTQTQTEKEAKTEIETETNAETKKYIKRKTEAKTETDTATKTKTDNVPAGPDHAPEGLQRARILKEKMALDRVTKERDAAVAQAEIERQKAEKARAEVEIERKRATKAREEAEKVHAFSTAVAAKAEEATKTAHKREAYFKSVAKEPKLQEVIALEEREMAVVQANEEHEAYEEARAEADAAELEEGLKRLENEPLQAAASTANWADVLQETTVQAPQEMANIAAKPEEEEVPVMHHAGRWKLATQGAGGYGWIAASQAKEASFEEAWAAPQGSEPELEVPVTHRTGRWMAASPVQEEEARQELSATSAEHAAVHDGISVAREADMAVVPERVLDAAASKLDDLLVTKLQEILASKVSLKIDAMLDSKLDAILGGQTAMMPASKASTNLMALQPAPQTNAAQEHKRRQTFVGVRLDGKHIFSQPAHDGRAVYTSDLAKDIGLKVTAVETPEHKIGDDMSVRVDVQTDKMNFRIWSSKADMFHNDSKLQVKYAHLNLNLLGPFPTHVGGFFAELRGKRPMGKRSKSFLRKADRRDDGRTVMGQRQ